MGTPDFAVASLSRLHEHPEFELVGVVTAPDRRAGRGRQLKASPVKEYAVGQHIPVLQPEKLRDPAFLAELDALDADLYVVVAFRMLPELVWSKPRKGTFNLHASLLPDYRGAAPINWVLINGEQETGATTFLIDHKIDTGQMLLQQKMSIPDEWNAGDLHDALMEMGADLVLETAIGLQQDRLTPQEQDHALYTHKAPKIFKESCRIDWQQPAETLYHFVRGLSPYPAAWTEWEGNNVKILGAIRAERTEKMPPGRVLQEENRLFVACGTAWLEILHLQLAGKKRMDTRTFLNGQKEEIGAFA